MALDKLALIAIIIAAILWSSVLLTGMIATWPFGLPALICFLVAGYFLYRVVLDRLSNAEDDYYEKHIDK